MRWMNRPPFLTSTVTPSTQRRARSLARSSASHWRWEACDVSFIVNAVFPIIWYLPLPVWVADYGASTIDLQRKVYCRESDSGRALQLPPELRRPRGGPLGCPTSKMNVGWTTFIGAV